MDKVIEKIRTLSKDIDLEQRFTDNFNTNVSIFDSLNLEKIDNAITIFEKNIELKNELEYQYQSKGDSSELDFWIINHWGGIHGFKNTENNIDKTKKFKQQLNVGKLTKDSFSTISSLSKIASFMYPEEFFIYDSRVIYALNWLILTCENRDELCYSYFPIPTSRNKILVNFDIQTVLNIYHSGQYTDFSAMYYDQQIAYFTYCNFIKKAAQSIYGESEKPYLIEMLLFVLADKEIFSEIKKVKLVF